MKEWYENLEPRERLFVTAGAALAVVMLVWALLVAPLTSGTAALERRVEEKRADLVRIQENIGRVPSAGPGSSPGRPSGPLVVVVDRSAKQAGLNLVRNQPVGDDAIRVRLEDSSFDAMAGWLAGLRQDHGLRIETASFDRAQVAGTVNANITLRQAGS